MPDADSLVVSLEGLERALPQLAQKHFEGGPQKRAKRLVAQQLSDLIVEEVFDEAKTPDGQPWLQLSGLTTLLRSSLGLGGTRPGEGDSDGDLRASFLLDGPENIFQETNEGFIFGSGIVRDGESVVEAFQETFATPQRPNSEEARSIRSFFIQFTGVPAPGEGKVLAHPGRRVLDLPPAWLEQLMGSYIDGMEDSMMAAAEDSLRAADAEISMARDRSGGLAAVGDFSARRREGRGGALQFF